MEAILKLTFLTSLVVIVFFIFCQEAGALYCWNCQKCPDPFDKNHINYTQVLCNGTCLKTVTEYHDIGLYVSRRCSDTYQVDTCKATRGRSEVCTCSGKDLCNRSPDVIAISIGTMLTSLAAFWSVYSFSMHSI